MKNKIKVIFNLLISLVKKHKPFYLLGSFVYYGSKPFHGSNLTGSNQRPHQNSSIYNRQPDQFGRSKPVFVKVDFQKASENQNLKFENLSSPSFIFQNEFNGTFETEKFFLTSSAQKIQSLKDNVEFFELDSYDQEFIISNSLVKAKKNEKILFANLPEEFYSEYATQLKETSKQLNFHSYENFKTPFKENYQMLTKVLHYQLELIDVFDIKIKEKVEKKKLDKTSLLLEQSEKKKLLFNLEEKIVNNNGILIKKKREKTLTNSNQCKYLQEKKELKKNFQSNSRGIDFEIELNTQIVDLQKFFLELN